MSKNKSVLNWTQVCQLLCYSNLNPLVSVTLLLKFKPTCTKYIYHDISPFVDDEDLKKALISYSTFSLGWPWISPARY
jgi:hypothetical protein